MSVETLAAQGLDYFLSDNKDKSENLVFARGFGFVLILFPQKKPLKRGNENGGDKARCYIKDKKQLGNFGG